MAPCILKSELTVYMLIYKEGASCRASCCPLIHDITLHYITLQNDKAAVNDTLLVSVGTNGRALEVWLGCLRLARIIQLV